MKEAPIRLKKDVAIEILVFISVVFGLAFLFKGTESTDLLIVPFAILVFIRLGYLVSSTEISFRRHILNFSNPTIAFLSYALFSLAAMALLWLSRGHIRFPIWLAQDNSLWIMPLHVLFQEIIFRTYLVTRMGKLLNNRFLVALSTAMVFAISHLILPEASMVAFFAFCTGFVWAWLYQKYPNIIWVWLSHLLVDASLHLMF